MTDNKYVFFEQEGTFVRNTYRNMFNKTKMPLQNMIRP